MPRPPSAWPTSASWTDFSLLSRHDPLTAASQGRVHHWPWGKWLARTGDTSHVQDVPVEGPGRPRTRALRALLNGSAVPPAERWRNRFGRAKPGWLPTREPREPGPEVHDQFGYPGQRTGLGAGESLLALRGGVPVDSARHGSEPQLPGRVTEVRAGQGGDACSVQQGSGGARDCCRRCETPGAGS